MMISVWKQQPACIRDLEIDPSMRLRALSKGTKEKVQLILVMSRDAQLYILDEPIGGVDPGCTGLYSKDDPEKLQRRRNTFDFHTSDHRY